MKTKKEIRDEIIKGLEQAYEQLVKYKRQINSPLVVSQNGQIIELDPRSAKAKTSYLRKTRKADEA